MEFPYLASLHFKDRCYMQVIININAGDEVRNPEDEHKVGGSQLRNGHHEKFEER
jgi:hypothetical protein